jgi:hypothetical protein
MTQQHLQWPAGIVTEADRERFAAYETALAFYEGRQWSGRPASGEIRLTFNYARSLLRKVAAYVFPAPATFTVPGNGDDETANRAEKLLAAAIADNDLGRLDVDLCVESSVLGDAAMKVTWDAMERKPVVAAVHPASLTARWAHDNPRKLARVAQLYQMTGAALAELFWSAADPRSVDADRAYPVIETWTKERWTVDVAGQRVRDEPNPYGWIPYVIAPNNQRPHGFWGESDLIDLVDVCRQLNSRMSVLAKVLELSGAPIAVIENVEESEAIRVGPGAKWELPAGARAYLLDLLSGGGIGLHISYIDLLYRTLHDLSETPRTAFGDAGRTLSGAALEVEIQPLVQKVHRKRRLWESVFRERNARLLDLIERFGGEEIGGLRRTVTVWPSVLPSDTESAVRNAAQLVTNGIQSRRTAAAALGGNDPDGELDRVLDELRRFQLAEAGMEAP